MRFAVAHIIYETGKWVREMRNETDRKVLLKDILGKISKETPAVHLMVLPAGFIMTRRVADCEPAATRILKSLPKKHPAIAFGIDCRRTNNGSEKIKSSSPPFFGYAVSDKKKKLVWNLRQQGTCAQDKIKKSDLLIDERIFKVGNKNIAFIICGEMTTKTINSNGSRFPEYISNNKDVDLFINITHGDRLIKPDQKSWFPAMKATGKPFVLSEHLGSAYRNHGLYCENSNLGPDYSIRLKKPKSIKTDEYYLKIYDLP